MGNRFRITVFGCMTGVLLVSAAFGANSGGKVLIREGAAVTGMAGELRMVKAEDGGPYIRFDGDDAWLFKLGDDVNDYQNVLEAGAELQLLPSSALEKLIADFKEHRDGSYRLWAGITKYKGVNYIFADFFVPVVEMSPAEFGEPNDVPEPNEPASIAAEPVSEPNMPADPNIAAATESEPNEVKEAEAPLEPVPQAAGKIDISELLTDPNGVLEVPQDVLDKLNSKKILVPRKMKPKAEDSPRKFKPREVVLPEKKIRPQVKAKDETEKDSGQAKNGQESKIVDSAGGDEAKVEPEKKPEPVEKPAIRLDTILADRTAKLIKQDGGLPVFVLDALGMSGPEASLLVLPCEVLELTELRIAAALNPMRFRIAGIKTNFKGKDYLLLQKATRVYGHGNFGN